MRNIVIAAAVIVVIITSVILLLQQVADTIPYEDDSIEAGLTDDMLTSDLETSIDDIIETTVTTQTIIPNMPHSDNPNHPVSATMATTTITTAETSDIITEPATETEILTTTTSVEPESIIMPRSNISPEYEQKIKADFAAYKSFLWGDLTADDIDILAYLGTYNGYDAVILYPKDLSSTDDMQYIEVAGQTITLTSGSYEILLYKNGVFTDIRGAYSLNYINENDVYNIKYYANTN